MRWSENRDRERGHTILIDLSGQKFGRLKVIQQVENDKHGKRKWLCKCNCENKNKIVVSSSDLRRSHTQSCGCLRKELLTSRSTQHGHSKIGKVTKIYSVWSAMKQRCTNPRNKNYKDYGGRGIKVCERWLKFDNFNKDMGKDWKYRLTLERKKNWKGYYPGNCYWATWNQQQRNKRNNHLIHCFGKTQSLVEWSEETKISEDTIDQRLKRGWDVKDALTTPVRNHR